MVTGSGQESCGWGRCVELVSTDGEPFCTLPSMPLQRVGHTQSGVIACGGQEDDEWPKRGYYEGTIGFREDYGSCHTFIQGVWYKSHMISRRAGHSVWYSNQYGVILMGGETTSSFFETVTYTYENINTTEMLSLSGKSKATFKLRYNTT